MSRLKQAFLSLCLLLAVVLSCGCGQEETAENTIIPYIAAPTSMENTPIVDYVVPVMSPNILVDNRGYSLREEKRAMVKGAELPEVFELIDAKSGETVCEGFISDITFSEELQVYTGIADFGEYEQEGCYYLECPVIGRSYTFELKEQMYRQQFQELYEIMIEKCRDGSLTTDEAILLLEANEWYADVFADEDKDGVPDVLTQLRGWISYVEENATELTEEALYVAFLAKYSYLYKNHDNKYATDCLKRASALFGQLQNTVGRDADFFFALTELYRATGLYTYRKQIEDYADFFENNSTYTEEIHYLYATMTYMVTRQKVNVNLCENFMNHLMERAEEISGRYADMINPVNAKNNGAEDLIKRAIELSCANYVTNNYQYTGILREFLHYLMGQNNRSVCFYEPETGGEYILLLAQLVSNEVD